MNTHAKSPSTTTPNRPSESPYRSHAAKRLAQYLRTELERADEALYVTGDRIADDVGLPPLEVERLLRQLSDRVPGLSIRTDPSGSRTVWRVSRP
ncbi:uncharacterized protein NP_2266A [Natronomonas pharaonis DSM 2160]|uniref:DUF7123 domain-containing protein n=1 Tax=Natronomonas pharaonis (strain ATCC 35678 / DSM 2160 / CIP 103997 / JCM 8858 / NBRC 14720 / NCIMB 2260 / Gabara) TaxID=348780 RepID=A0A1U7EVX1_NATPD|nr:hypothetical protein [Natronomonas pharaonis]CAI49224.1 uncharacterized protein NP_2266A [Natronomonas pharaonis DSM 2160]